MSHDLVIALAMAGVVYLLFWAERAYFDWSWRKGRRSQKVATVNERPAELRGLVEGAATAVRCEACRRETTLFWEFSDGGHRCVTCGSVRR